MHVVSKESCSTGWASSLSFLNFWIFPHSTVLWFEPALVGPFAFIHSFIHSSQALRVTRGRSSHQAKTESYCPESTLILKAGDPGETDTQKPNHTHNTNGRKGKVACGGVVPKILKPL